MKKIKNAYFLLGPLGLLAFALMDCIGGTNYPGFNRMNQVIYDLTALDSYCLPISLTFSIIGGLLIIVAAFLVRKYFKTHKINKTFSKGITCVLLAAILAGAGLNIFLVQQAGTSAYFMDTVSEIKAQNESIDTAKIAIAEAESQQSSNEVQNDSSDTSSTTDSATSSSTATDIESTVSAKQQTIETANQKINELKDAILEKISNPLIIARFVVMGLALLAVFASCIFLAIGGLRKNGIKTIGVFSLVLLLLYIAAFIVQSIFMSTYTGITFRVIAYAPYLLVAFISAWVYVYEPVKK